MPTARRLRSLTVAALISLGVGGNPLPAFASTLAITSLECERRHGGYVCDAYVSGGTGAYTYLWNSGAITNSYDHESGSRIVIGCPVGATYSRTISFKVTDSSGATASQTTIADCGATY